MNAGQRASDGSVALRAIFRQVSRSTRVNGVALPTTTADAADVPTSVEFGAAAGCSVAGCVPVGNGSTAPEVCSGPELQTARVTTASNTAPLAAPCRTRIRHARSQQRNDLIPAALLMSPMVAVGICDLVINLRAERGRPAWRPRVVPIAPKTSHHAFSESSR